MRLGGRIHCVCFCTDDPPVQAVFTTYRLGLWDLVTHQSVLLLKAAPFLVNLLGVAPGDACAMDFPYGAIILNPFSLRPLYLH